MVSMFVDVVPNRNSRPTILIRQAYREGGKARKRTLANITKLPPDAVEKIRKILRGADPADAPVKLEDAFTISRSLQHGNAAAVLAALRGVTTGLKLPKSAEAEFPSQGAANSFRGACPPERKQSKIPSDFFAEGGSGRVIKLEKIVMLQELKREGLSISAIARRTGLDRKTVRKLLDRGLAAPAYSPRKPRPRLLEPYEDYLADKIGNCPDLSGRRLFRQIQELGYEGGYTAVTDYLRAIRPDEAPRFERRFETRPGEQAQVDFAEFKTEYADEPGVFRKVHLFSFVLGCSRWLWGRFCADQKLETVLRCHVSAFDACGGATKEVLYDRMKTAVLGEDADRSAVYNPSLVALLDHYGSAPKACKAYRAKTKGKVERPFRYIRQDFFLDRTFRCLDDLNAQFDDWRGKVANPRVHATTGRIVDQAFAEEQGYLIPLPAHPYDAVLTVERRVSRDGMVSVGGNLYSVPDAARKRVLEVQRHPAEVRIFEDRTLIARHPILEGRNRRRVDPGHRRPLPPRPDPMQLEEAPKRSLAFYDAVGRRLERQGAAR